jgi:putative ABC transport system permease protein
MLAYYLKLALKSFRRNPGLTALMVLAIAVGIAICVMSLTVFQAMSGNPIWWKSDRLYSVTMDSWNPNVPFDERFPDLPPPQMTYKDAMALYRSDIPERKVVMNKGLGVFLGGSHADEPVRTLARLTTADFFSMFDVPFQYGSAWNAKADFAPEPVIVLSHEFNRKMFGGANSVGRLARWNGQEFRVIGVLAEWTPRPKYYDLNNGSFADADDFYIPFGWNMALEVPAGGNVSAWRNDEEINSYQDLLGSDCIWLQMWVELPTAAARERMQAFMDSYWAEQRKSGRFQRPRNNRLTDVEAWLKDRKVVQNDNRMLVVLSFAFLAVCLINTVGLLLAKFLNAAAISGVRRALGASRRQIFHKHIIEVGLLAVGGALLGLAFGALGLWGVRALYSNGGRAADGYAALARFDMSSVVWALVLALVSALAAGLYPAWRVGRLPPAVYLKSQ